MLEPFKRSWDFNPDEALRAGHRFGEDGTSDGKLDEKQNFTGHCPPISTIQKADLIVVLNQGKIVETGTHKELLAKNRLTRTWWSCKLYEIALNFFKKYEKKNTLEQQNIKALSSSETQEVAFKKLLLITKKDSLAH